jgi:hypothetical protein
MILPLNGAVFQQAVGEFFNEKRVASGSVKDQFLKFGHHLTTFENVLHQLGTAFGGELIHTDFAVKRLAAPLMRIFWPVKQNQQDVSAGQPIDQIV